MKRLIYLLIFVPYVVFTQNIAKISGNFQLEAQTYKKDSVIGAPDVKEKILSNGFLNLNYTLDNFNAGLRYEAYLNPILGYDPQYKGYGISYRYASWSNDFLSATVGDFYEQFGSGMIFRAYEERALGIDNAVEGFRVKLRPSDGLEITGLIGKQRIFWGKSDGIVRGGDFNLALNEFAKLELPFDIKLGGSIVSRYQKDDDPFLRLPENVLAYSIRFGLSGSSILFDAEFGYKYNDPNTTNNNFYNNGYGLSLNGSYFTKGFSFALSAHKLDNMDFRSDRSAAGNNLTLSYIPPINKQSPYKLPNMFPFATKLNGEAGIQAEINYVLPASSVLGGKYGTNININFSRIQSIDTTHTSQYKYNSDLFAIGDRLFYQDFTINFSKKFSSKFEGSLSYINIIYDKDILENEGAPKYGKIKGNFLIMDGTYKIDDKNAIHFELQHLWAKQDSSAHLGDTRYGNWISALLEYSVSPSFYFSISDDYNYGNEFDDLKIHYYSASFTYVVGSNRIQLSYGKQNQGVICVGGICRRVPASNGFYLSISSSF